LPRAVHGARVSEIKIWNKYRECLQRVKSLSVGEFKYCKTCKVVKSKHVITQRKEDFKPRDFGEVILVDKEVGWQRCELCFRLVFI
jgi:hypothetical protein